MTATSHCLFCFGLGYSAHALARRLAGKGWRIAGTTRDEAGAETIEKLGYEGWLFDGHAPVPSVALDGVTHVLVSIPPGPDGDPVLEICGAELARRSGELAWLGYLSTTGVYGDRSGGWVDEDSPLEPVTDRGRRRLAAEEGWLRLSREHGLPMHIFRLAGIYGPGRNQLEAVLAGTARRIVKEGQVFSRIHVEDVAGVLEASIARPRPGGVYNVADDEPAPPQEVVEYAARILGRPPPRTVPFDEAELSPMARSFYAESKRVANRHIKQELGYRLQYPTYREGLQAILAGL